MHLNLNMLTSFLEKKLQKTTLGSKPWKFFIEVSLSCNLRCVTCGHHDATFGGIMHGTVFEKIKPTLSSARVVHEVGYGEPFLDPDFMQKLSYFKQLGARVGVYTNGMLVDAGVSQKLVDLGLDQITFSVDGGTAQTFEEIRIGARYDRLMENIGNLQRIKTLAKAGTPLLRANYVGMRRNILELPRAIRTLSRVGVQEVVLSDFTPPAPEFNRECLFYAQDLADEAIRQAVEVAGRCRVNFIFPAVFNEPQPAQGSPPEPQTAAAPVDRHPPPVPLKGVCVETPPEGPAAGKRHEFPCYEPWQTLYITHDGHVRPCCALTESFGNLLRDDIDQIWNSPKYRLLRKTVNSPEPAFEACRSCLLRRRVRFPLRNIIDMGVQSLRNDGLGTSCQKAIKYLSEYF